MPFDVTIWGAFLAGLLSFASPCVLPLAPPYLAFIAGVSFNELAGRAETAAVGGPRAGAPQPGVARARIIATALVFVLGFATVFTLMGASASALGAMFSAHRWWLSYVAGAVIIVMGLHFLGVFRIGVLYRQAKIEGPKKPVGLFGAYLVGLAFAFGWSPCAGPVLAAILFAASGMGDPMAGAALLFVYALGIGLPFILIALFAGSFLTVMNRFKAHLGRVEQALGVLLVLTGVLFVTGGMPAITAALAEWFPSIAANG